MRKYKGFAYAWWLVLIYTLIMLFIPLIKNSFFSYISDNLLSFIVQFSIVIPILIGISILKLYHPYDTVKNMMGFYGFNINLTIPFIILPVCASFFISYATAPFTAVVSEIFGYYDPGFIFPANIKELAYQIFSLCIAAPVLEEIFFRGILLKLFDRYGTLTAVIMSSLAFSLMHFEPSAFLSIFLLGATICILRLGTGSVFAGMLFHCANNYFSLMGLIFKNAVYISDRAMTVFSIAAAALFPVLMFIFIKFFSSSFYFEGIGEKKGFSLGFTLMLIIYTAVCIQSGLSI